MSSDVNSTASQSGNFLGGSRFYSPASRNGEVDYRAREQRPVAITGNGRLLMPTWKMCSVRAGPGLTCELHLLAVPTASKWAVCVPSVGGVCCVRAVSGSTCESSLLAVNNNIPSGPLGCPVLEVVWLYKSRTRPDLRCEMRLLAVGNRCQWAACDPVLVVVVWFESQIRLDLRSRRSSLWERAGSGSC